MNELKTLLAKNKIIIPLTLDERIMSMKILLDGIRMVNFEIKTNKSFIDLVESRGGYADDELHEAQEKRRNTLRGLKNSFRMQEAALHEAMRNTDEV